MRWKPEHDTILNILYSANEALTTAEIVRQSEMSWITVNNYLKTLHNWGYVVAKRVGKFLYWRLNENNLPPRPLPKKRKMVIKSRGY